jgi:hypothetical protein
MGRQILEIVGQRTTEIHPQTRKMVHDLRDTIFKKLTKWCFLTAGPPMVVKKYDGSMIRYQGIKFKGAPKHVFWKGFIEPFLENGSIAILNQTSAMAQKCNLSISECLNEAETLLNILVTLTYEKMADIDQKLSGDGFKKGPRVEVLGKISSMNSLIKSHRRIAELEHSTQDPETTRIESQEDILDVKPNIFGVGINLNAAFRWAKKKVQKN